MRAKTRLAVYRSRLQRVVCCQIPKRHLNTVRFPHPVGIVIGDGVRIGTGVRIYQNVTIGLLENTPASDAVDQYPTIGDDVIIYAGAVIAGAVAIGAGSVIGANAVITKDVPAGSVAFGRNQIMSPRQDADPRTAATEFVTR
jgi:serine acetyltransferase